MASLLIIEDDSRIREALAKGLAARGHDVETVAAALEGIERVVATNPDIVLLDLGLPDLDGREALKMIRAVSQVPVLVATARDDEAEIVTVLEAGADDYVVKPFSVEQINARIGAILRRVGEPDDDGVVTVGGITIDALSRVVTLGSAEIDLTKKEFDLLLYLAERPGTVVGKRELLAEVWRQPYGGADKTVDVHLSWLRKKLGETASDPIYLHTIRGVGVRLSAP
jgi:DNA-binding response OmpR family regulator